MGKKGNSGGFGLTDNTQASPVRSIKTNSEKYDMGRCKYNSVGTQGYPSQASQQSKKKGM